MLLEMYFLAEIFQFNRLTIAYILEEEVATHFLCHSLKFIKLFWDHWKKCVDIVVQ